MRRIGLSVGIQTMDFPAAFDPGQVSVHGGVPAAGGTLHYQAWYRDVSVHCASTFNTKNGLTLTWTP